MSYFIDLIELIYPNLCAGCGNPLWKSERLLCTFCDFHLPRTGFHLERENQLTKLFWGRACIENAASYLYFNKGNITQHLVHLLKYKGRKDIGIWLGQQYGHSLRNSAGFNSIDLILPVPLHPKKLATRGFNQSEQFAIGLGTSMNLPVETQLLLRKKASETQTKKTRFLRWQNVEEIFIVQAPRKLEGKSLLLVDDVVTTGATLESCISAFSGISGTRISVATIAIASS